jgi:hypothetical protein
MSLIVDINPVPWEILEQVKARLLRNRAKKQKRQPEKGKELRRVMQVDNGILAKQRWEESSFIGDASIARIVVLLSWVGTFENGSFTQPATKFEFIEPASGLLSPFINASGGIGGYEWLNGFAAMTFIVDKTEKDPTGTLYLYQQFPDLVSIKLSVQADYRFDFLKITTVSVYAFDENDFLLRLNPNSEGLVDQGIKYAYAFKNSITQVIKLNNPGESLIYQGLPGETGILEIPLDGSSAFLT